ncbi:hypothetical protein [Pedobacter ureilyticus]|uniref:PH domain-containing protein n=1 Tax=Pedobacter ureilyticus TaxID=1393051 RepID=A0ABW9J5W1_9SPHI|nr:hypothetical protein [Pedobacter helvus]
MKLEENEIIVQKIDHSNKIPFRLEDLITFPFFIIFSIVGSNIFKEISSKEIYYVFILPVIAILTFFLTFGRILIRWHITRTTIFYLTNYRIIFVDNASGFTDKSFHLKEIEINYTEYLNGKGFIIIGKSKPVFSGRGVNFFEDKNVIYNVINVKKVFDLIKNVKAELLSFE